MLDDTLETVLEIQAEAAERLQAQDDPDAGIAMQVNLMHFEMATEGGAAAREAGTAKAPAKRSKARR